MNSISRFPRHENAPPRALLPAALVALIAMLVLIGWRFDLEPLKRMIPEMVAMNPMTAVGFLFAAVSLSGAARGRASAPGLRWLSRGCALLVIGIAAARLAAILWGFDLGVDRWLFTPKLLLTVIPNRIAPNTACNFLFIGSALLLLHSRQRRLSAWASALALLCGFVSLVVILGYAFSIEFLYGVKSFIPMALHTALCFLVLVLVFGVMACQARRGFLAILTGDNPGGLMAQRMLRRSCGVSATSTSPTIGTMATSAYAGSIARAISAGASCC